MSSRLGLAVVLAVGCRSAVEHHAPRPTKSAFDAGLASPPPSLPASFHPTPVGGSSIAVGFAFSTPQHPVPETFSIPG
jgi:hypothetical protein